MALRRCRRFIALVICILLLVTDGVSALADTSVIETESEVLTESRIIESGDEGEPYKDDKGEYVYKYKVSISGIEEDAIYDTYEAAKERLESIKSENGDVLNLTVKAEAVQSLDEDGSEGINSENWYKFLSDSF